jgi:hypothetical protein
MGLFSMTEKGAAKYDTVLSVIWTILLTASLIPMFTIEMSLGLAMREGFDLKTGGDEGVEYYRVREIGWSGLTIALAAAFLMVTCNVAKERNVQRDVGYFKTSSPGDSTKRIVAASTETMRVLLFFPQSNAVKEQVRSYFDALQSASGHLTIEEHDRLVNAELAGKYKVTKDGVIIIIKGTGDKEKSDDRGRHRHREGAQGRQQAAQLRPRSEQPAAQARPREAQGVRDDGPRRDHGSRFDPAGSQGSRSRAPHDGVQEAPR